MNEYELTQIKKDFKFQELFIPQNVTNVEQKQFLKSK